MYYLKKESELPWNIVIFTCCDQTNVNWTTVWFSGKINKIRAFQQMEFALRLDLILSRVVLMACQNDATELASASIGHGVSLQHLNWIPLFLVSMHILKVFHSSLRQCKGSKSYLYQGLILSLQASSTHKRLIGNWISHDISDVPCIHCWSFC